MDGTLQPDKPTLPYTRLGQRQRRRGRGECDTDKAKDHGDIGGIIMPQMDKETIEAKRSLRGRMGISLKELMDKEGDE